jgi:uncharacterized Ntn-hydrolase superfamily protein
LEEGHDAEETLRILLSSDPEVERRQVGIVDSLGNTAAHTGALTDSWRGHLRGEGYTVMGNLLTGREVVIAMANAFETSEGEPFAERLVRALEAGQEAGGDKRGRQSAAIRMIESQPYPYLDLRVDEHQDPVAELRRIYEVAKVELLPFIDALPTRENSKASLGEEIRGTLIPE